MSKLYRYKGLDILKERRSGYIRAESRQEAIEKLKEKNITAIYHLKEKLDIPIFNRFRREVNYEAEKILIRIKDKITKNKIINKKKKENKVPLKNKINNFFQKYSFENIKKALKESKGMEVDKNFIEKFKLNLEEEYLKSGKDIDDFILESQASRERRLQEIRRMKKDIEKETKKEINWDLIDIRDKSKKNVKDRYKVKLEELILFTRQFRMMLNAGVVMNQALEILKSQTEGDMSELIGELNEDVELGIPFSEALAKHPEVFSNNYVALMSIGEDIGSYNDVAENIIKDLEMQNDMRAKLKNATIYPIIVGIVVAVLVVFATQKLIPTFAEMFVEQNVELPLITRIVFGLSEYLSVIVIGLIIGLIGVMFFRKVSDKFNKKVIAFIDKLKLKLPIVRNVSNSAYMYSIASSIYLMRDSGVQLIDSLELIRRSIGNVYIQNELADVSLLVDEGFPLSYAFQEQEYIDKLLASVSHVGEETGKLTQALEEISIFYENNLNRSIDNIKEAIHPLMTISLLVIVGPIILAIYFPLFEITSGGIMG